MLGFDERILSRSLASSGCPWFLDFAADTGRRGLLATEGMLGAVEPGELALSSRETEPRLGRGCAENFALAALRTLLGRDAGARGGRGAL